MGRKSLANERRAEIAQGLYLSIAKRGYANTTVRDIAKESEVALGVITHYFDSKEEILHMLADHVFEQYQEGFSRFLDSHSDKSSRERLKLGIKIIFEDIAGNRSLISVFQELFTLSRHDKKLRASLRRLYKRYRENMVEFLKGCAQDTNLSDVDLKRLAAFLVGASEGISEQWSLDPQKTKLSEMTEMADMFVDFYFKGRDK